MNLCVACKIATEGYGDPHAYNPSKGEEGEVTDLDEQGFTIPGVLLFLVLLFDILPAEKKNSAYGLLPVKEMYHDGQEVDEVKQNILSAIDRISSETFEIEKRPHTPEERKDALEVVSSYLTDIRNLVRGGEHSGDHSVHRSLTELLEVLTLQPTVLHNVLQASTNNSSLTTEERRTAKSTIFTIRRMRDVLRYLLDIRWGAVVADITSDDTMRIEANNRRIKKVVGQWGMAAALPVLAGTAWWMGWHREKPQPQPQLLVLPSVRDTATSQPVWLMTQHHETTIFESVIEELGKNRGSLATAAVKAYDANRYSEQAIFLRRDNPKYQNVLAVFSSKPMPWADLGWEVKRFFITNIDDMTPSGNKDDSVYVRNILSFVENWERESELECQPDITTRGVNDNRVVEPFLIEMFEPYIKFLRSENSNFANFANITLVKPKIEGLAQKIGLGSLQLFAAPADIIYDSLKGVKPVQDVLGPAIFLGMWATAHRAIQPQP